MFAKTIIDSDAFLDMPLSTQCLYFHLSMRADDEGFVNNPKKIQRMIGASEDDLKILAAKNFVIPFDSGIVVIKHWRIHNYIRADRLSETKYQDEKAQLMVKDNNAYTLKPSEYSIPCQSSVSQVSVTCQSNDGIDKNSIDKNSIDKNNIDAMFDQFWSLYPKKADKKKAKASFVKINPDDALFTTMLNAIKKQKQSDQWQRGFVPNATTWLNGERWNDDLPKAPQASKKYTDYIQREPIKNDRFGMEYVDETFGTEYLRKS